MGLSLGERNVAIQSRTDKGPSRAAEIAHVVDDEMSEAGPEVRLTSDDDPWPIGRRRFLVAP